MSDNTSPRNRNYSEVARRYVSALLMLTTETAETDRVAQELGRFAALMSKSDDLRYLVRSPTFSVEEQLAAVTGVLKQAEITGLTAQFIGFVTANRRLNRLPEMIECFEYEAILSKGTVFADVVFAHPPSEGTIETVTSVLKEVTQKKVNLITSIDPELIGGLVVTINSRMVDGSIRSKLNSLRQSMREYR